MMTQGLVVDDHPIVCEGLRALLQTAFPSISVKSSPGNHAVLQEICSHPWVFVVLDINLPGQNGLDIVKKVHVSCPHIPIIVFSLYSEEQYEVRALRAGAVAYLSKDRTPIELVDAVKRIVRGEMPHKPAEALVDPVLSAREMQVLKFFARGMNPKEISRELGISAKTVGTYRFRLLNKLGVRNSIELMRYAVEEGLVDSKRA